MTVTNEIKDAAAKLFALGEEYIAAYDKVCNDDNEPEGALVDCNEDYLEDKFPALIGELFGDLTESETEDLSGQCFGATELHDSPGFGYTLGQVETLLTEFFERYYNAHPSPE